MIPESIKCVTENIVASYAVLGSGKLVFGFKCFWNRLITSRGTLWPLTRFLEVVNYLTKQMFPESIKYAMGDIVASYAFLGSGKLVSRSKCSLNLLNTPRGNIFGLREAAARQTLDCE